MEIRPAAVAGTWYPGSRGALAREVDGYLAEVPAQPPGSVRAILAPHAGIMFSGPVAAHAYKAVAAGDYDMAVLVGPSHFHAFEGVAAYPSGGFDSPLGVASIDSHAVAALTAAEPVIHIATAPHRREHSLEMQVPFLRRLLPDLPIVPLLMGAQRRDTVEALAEALATTLVGRRPLLVGSTDLSHYFDAETAATLDRRVQDCVTALDPERLLDLVESYPSHEQGRYVACGAGPAAAVMLAARRLGATTGRVLKYGHSGEVSGDYGGVVGYMAAAIGQWPA